MPEAGLRVLVPAGVGEIATDLHSQVRLARAQNPAEPHVEVLLHVTSVPRRKGERATTQHLACRRGSSNGDEHSSGGAVGPSRHDSGR